jgi:serine phosphatase RsbU (regulator of sigma subunit)
LVYQQSGLATVSLYRVKSQEAWPEETLKLLDSVTEQIALALFQAGLYRRIQEQTAQMQAELEVARQIQTNLLRQSWPDLDRLSIQARCRPARQVGGDFFEVFVHPSGDIWLAVGDVSGKGVPAALFMASAISVLRRELSQEKPPPPDQVMQNLNQGLLDDLVTNNCFITMALVRYTPDSHELMYANAGHIYPIIWSTQTHDNDAKPEYLKVRGVPLGILPVWKAKAGETALPSGSTLLLASDGITEATIPDDQHPNAAVMLQQEGLWQLLRNQPRPLDLDTLLLAIQGDKDQQEDDQTILSLEVM